MSYLFSPIDIGPMHLENRIVMPPMCQFVAEDGKASAWHLIHYGACAAGGVGLTIIEATAVRPDGRISPFDLGLWSDETEAAFVPLVEGLKKWGNAKIAIQLAHAGRKASVLPPWEGGRPAGAAEGGWPVVSASPLAYDSQSPTPRELTEDDLNELVEQFAQAGRRAARLGFDAVEIHAAHGYLLHQFLSPLSNARRDHWGETIEGRMAFPLAVFSALRDALPASVALGVRVSATDWAPGGWDPVQCAIFAQELEARGCQFLHVSSGGLTNEQKIELYPGYQIPLAARMKGACTMPVIGVGLIREPELAESILAQGQADLVAIGRGLLYEPHWPWQAALHLGETVLPPRQYLHAAPRGVTLFR